MTFSVKYKVAKFSEVDKFIKGINVDPLYLCASFLSCFLPRKGDTLQCQTVYTVTALKILSTLCREKNKKNVMIKFYGAKERAKIAFNWCECVIKKEKGSKVRRKGRQILHSSLTWNIKANAAA